MSKLLLLFWGFFQIGLFSVGGGYAAIPLIQSQMVEKYGFLELSEFTDLITIAEMTPGSIAINAATFVGTRVAGLTGAIVSTIGCVLPSFVICLILAYFYYKYRKFTGVQTVLASLRPAVVALIASAGISILMLGIFGDESIAIKDFKVVEAVLFAVCLFVLRKWKVNVMYIIFGSGVVGTIVYLIMGALA